MNNTISEENTVKKEQQQQKNPIVVKIEKTIDNFTNTGLGRFITGFGNAQIAGDSGAATSVATASGYEYNPENRRFEQTEERLNDPSVEALRDNLAFISTFSPTHYGTAFFEKAVIPGISYVGGKTLRPIFKEIKKLSPKKAKLAKTIVSDPETGILLYTPDELINSGDFNRGKELAAKFFEHPVVQESYKHNQKLAKRLGVIIPDKPDAAQIVRRPVKVTQGNTLDQNAIAEIWQDYYGSPNTYINMNQKAFPINDLRQASIHENLHRGYYSAPLKPKNLSQQYYKEVYIPEHKFWKWKTDKLLNEFGKTDNYLSDVPQGEAGPNLIDIGRDLGLKLGQKYPGYDVVKKMLETYNGSKAFLIPRLNMSKAGLRHVWDAMTGKYFTPTAGVIIGTSINNDNE